MIRDFPLAPSLKKQRTPMTDIETN